MNASPLAPDYAPTAKSAVTLARQFGVTFLDGWAIEPKNHDSATGRHGFIVLSRSNGQLLDHAITRGIDQVRSFTDQAMLFPEGATPFLKVSPGSRPIAKTSPESSPSRRWALPKALRSNADTEGW